MNAPVFRDRRHAGRALAQVLTGYANRSDVIVLALPRGGVPVAYEVATTLHAPLDVFVVRKLGIPGNEEYAMGALATGGVRILNDNVTRILDIPADAIEAVVRTEQRELDRREHLYRDARQPPALRGRTVILVDDGLATGSTMLAAVKAVGTQDPQRIVVAVPTASAETCNELRAVADEVVCVNTPRPFRAVGQWYENFEQTTDDEVLLLLASSRLDAVNEAR